MKKSLLSLSLLCVFSYGENEHGCTISSLVKSTTNPFTQENNCSNALSKEKTTKISEQLTSVKVLHENVEVLIEREIVDNKFTCPPFCIQPMKIEEVKTVGELEALAFIDKLKEKKSRLLIDVRESVDYEKATIPGAINLPFSMFSDGSKYQKEILKLLGGKKVNNKWIFKNPQILLVFGKNVISNEASSMIKKLVEFGYPTNKLLFYRSGFESWKHLGLTTY